ncbi:hypothetical protein KCV07_g332, partial [Aureobasidium melanogenum]
MTIISKSPLAINTLFVASMTRGPLLPPTKTGTRLLQLGPKITASLAGRVEKYGWLHSRSWEAGKAAFSQSHQFGLRAYRMSRSVWYRSDQASRPIYKGHSVPRVPMENPVPTGCSTLHDHVCQIHPELQPGPPCACYLALANFVQSQPETGGNSYLAYLLLEDLRPSYASCCCYSSVV